MSAFVSLESVTNRTRVPLEDTTRALFADLGLAYPGGKSEGRGWSSQATLQTCPYLFKRTYLDGVRGGSRAMDIGSMVHLGLAVRHLRMMDPSYPLTTDELFRAVLARTSTHGEEILEARRLVQAYESEYAVDYYSRILSVEESYTSPTGDSCRWDYIAEVDASSGLFPGVYGVDIKTASRFDASATDGWSNNGELLGEVMHYIDGGFEEKYGPLRGLIVDIIGKQKNPQFMRVVLPVNHKLLDQHRDELAKWNAMRNFYKAADFWPRARGNCIGQYGKCQRYDECADLAG